MNYEIHSNKYFGVEPGEVNPEFSDFDKRMQEGYGFFFKDEYVPAIELWQNNFNEMKEYFVKHQISELKVYDDIYNGNEYTSNWVQDFDEALWVAITKSSPEDKQRFAALRIELLDFLQNIDVGSENNRLGNIRSLAETYYKLGDFEKGEELFKGLIDENPYYTWGYIGYSDQYWLEDKENTDYIKAMEILKRAYYLESIDEIDMVIERMTELQIAIEKEKFERFTKINDKDKVPEGTDIAEILEQIRKTEDILPLAELEYMNAHKNEVLHLALKEMKEYAGDPIKYATENDFFSLYIPMLLGQWEVRKASKYLIDLVACTDEEIDRTIGDMIVGCYSVVLYKCFDGNIDYLKEMIEKEGIGEFSTLAYLQVLSMFWIFDQNNLPELMDYLEQLFIKRPETASLITGVIMEHHNDELLPITEKCIASEFYDPSIYGDREEYMFHFNDFSNMETDRYTNRFDVIDELSGWYSYTAKKPVISKYNELYSKLGKDRKKIFPGDKIEQKAAKGRQTVVYNSPKTGRNEPCPCGSGKKYKKCCGK